MCIIILRASSLNKVLFGNSMYVIFIQIKQYVGD